MKTFTICLCLLLAGCGAGSNSNPNSKPNPNPNPALAFSNGQTLATATSYWTGACTCVFGLGREQVPTIIDFELTSDGGFETAINGSICNGTYSDSPTGGGGFILQIQNSCPESSDYIEDLVAPSGDSYPNNFGASGVLVGGVGFSGTVTPDGSQPCAFTLVQGKQ
jgi:hypothetical protein